MSKLKDIDRAITIVEFILKQSQEEVEDYNRKLELTETQKIRIGRMTDLIKNVNFLIRSYQGFMNMTLGRQPIWSQEMEENVLGAIMLESGNYTVFNQVSAFLKPEHFHSEYGQKIWKAILDLNSRNEPFDMSMVTQEIRRTGLTEVVGGAYKIADLVMRVSSAASAVHHARIVVQLAMQREFVKIGADLIQGGFDETQDPFDLLEHSENMHRKIYSWLRDAGYQAELNFKGTGKSVSIKQLKQIVGE